MGRVEIGPSSADVRALERESRPAVRSRRMGPRLHRRAFRGRRARGAGSRTGGAVKDSVTAAGHESGGARTPRGGVFVDLRLSCGLGFGARAGFGGFGGTPPPERPESPSTRPGGSGGGNRGRGCGCSSLLPGKAPAIRADPGRAGGNPSRGAERGSRRAVHRRGCSFPPARLPRSGQSPRRKDAAAASLPP